MERIGFTMRILDGQVDEYVRRHEAVWPELLDDLMAAGLRTYSIFRRDHDLFAYLEVDDFATFTAEMARSDANARWQREMTALIDPLTDPATGFHTRIPEVFHLDRDRR
jgi:L-rhamnose mutarotase